MAKITNYPYITDIKAGNVFLVDGPGGTAQLQGLDAPYAIVGQSADKATAHCSIFRGKNLGTSISAEQQAAIADGSFTDIWVGDYWEIDGVKWRVVDLDYFYNVNAGDGFITHHHAVLMPDCPIAVCRNYDWREIQTPAQVGPTGYAVSGGQIWSCLTSSAETYQPAYVYHYALISGEKLTVRDYIVNRFGDLLNAFTVYEHTASYSKAWKTTYVALPNEIILTGRHHFTMDGYRRYLSDGKQMALFRVAPRFMEAEPRTFIANKGVSGYEASITTSIYMTKDQCGSDESNGQYRWFVIVDSAGRINDGSVIKTETALSLGLRPYIVVG